MNLSMHNLEGGGNPNQSRFRVSGNSNTSKGKKVAGSSDSKRSIVSNDGVRNPIEGRNTDGNRNMILDGKMNSDGGRSLVIEGVSKLGKPNLFEKRSSGNSSLNEVRTQITPNKEDDETEAEGIEELITARFGERSVERFMRRKADINKLSKQVEVQSEALSQVVVRVPDSYGNPNSANEVVMEETQQHEDVLIVDDEKLKRRNLKQYQSGCCLRSCLLSCGIGNSKVGSAIGRPLLADKAVEERKRTNYARLCIEMDLKCKYPNHVDVVVDQRRAIRVAVEYNWRPTKCMEWRVAMWLQKKEEGVVMKKRDTIYSTWKTN
ncbi:hypothetical protein FRX31_019859 [Thalictrum thalictroides]|uniref:Uncharacterized protein n=1 Tax=Thalictrum thalictroides TaxID=46969 RepID=A0A7J6VZL4_THATH|nr:hypothetical protein FRX31_019859 [Thalictrum thalictroides]